MPRYCVNRQAQETGEHEVHNLDAGCQHLPDYSNRLDLGWHTDCHSAVSAAKQYYSNVDGCYYCCNACHTR